MRAICNRLRNGAGSDCRHGAAASLRVVSSATVSPRELSKLLPDAKRLMRAASSIVSYRTRLRYSGEHSTSRAAILPRIAGDRGSAREGRLLVGGLSLLINETVSRHWGPNSLCASLTGVHYEFACHKTLRSRAVSQQQKQSLGQARSRFRMARHSLNTDR